ncbi:decarboxylating 6-phosphogluconate dehydrogenase [Phycicoccus endophyticus]|uniref:Decarboxylating 6-phosphogluconate dehydrogenase n=1 Tax=Phycicoccus endophyticus TaxID=1690220 RepID=A0A7G9R0X2_9MICO|nr:decarboxylating 6-phosphogluconate dehydrogenase [Phycicoccus endophyticus]NHI19541.1 decarboxylating 6-phosphogluconate dehydrogenase [Phycicoccus endophyticus]QNN49247.1 decarboxylating 6-phosphogluconate dehydrogenase [Phycicoccus endophyticus]GGL39968.1 6-phosphogluconate dehydrogenase [Phycicoccus endophyticus]
MQLGLVGLGKMGGNMRERLRRAGHEVVGYDRNKQVSDARSLADMVRRLDAPRVVWVMVPHGKPTRDTVAALAELLEKGDLVIDGGNSKWTDDVENEKLLKEAGVGYVDCGVSGGIWGLENGYGLMAGGTKANVRKAMPIFDALRPEGPRDEGFVHAGKVGAGHYTKMVHNGIEYGLMAAYAEGYELLTKKDIVDDVPGAFKAWSRGTVVRSWLLDLMVDALEEKPTLEDVSDYTSDSGEGRWTVEEAIELAVPMPVISASLFARFASRQQVSPTMQAVAALRGQFGGHQVMTVAEGEALRAEAAAGPASPDTATRKAARKEKRPSKKAAAKKAAQAAEAGPASPGRTGGPRRRSSSTG